MIKLYGDYHTHTVYSHGKGTILDNVAEARKKGLKEIAITDHGPGHYSFGIKKTDIKRMREEVDELNRDNSDIRVLLGIEANLVSMDGGIDIDEEIIKYLDIILLGYHMPVAPKSFRDFYWLYIENFGSMLSKSTYNKVMEKNTNALIRAINTYPIDIITHPGAMAPIDTAELAKAAASRGTALEINSNHGFLTVEYAKIAAAQGVKFYINSDAHLPQNVGRFDNGIKTAEEAGLSIESIINAEKNQE